MSIARSALDAMRGVTRRSDDSPWIVVRTEPRREETAKESLGREGFEVYLPVRKQLVLPPRNTLSHRQRQNYFQQGHWEPRPWLPGYLFVKAGYGRTSLRSLHTLVGVIGPVFFGEELALVHASEIAVIRKREAEDTLDTYEGSSPFGFEVDEEIRIADGLLTGFNAKVESVDPTKQKIGVLANLLGALRRIDLHISQVEKL